MKKERPKVDNKESPECGRVDVSELVGGTEDVRSASLYQHDKASYPAFMILSWIEKDLSMRFYDTSLLGASASIQVTLGTACNRITQKSKPKGIREAIVVAVLSLAIGQLGRGFNPADFFGLVSGAAQPWRLSHGNHW